MEAKLHSYIYIYLVVFFLFFLLSLPPLHQVLYIFYVDVCTFYIYSTRHNISISMHNLIKWDNICGYNSSRFFSALADFVLRLSFYFYLSSSSFFFLFCFAFTSEIESVAVDFLHQYYYSDCILKISVDLFVLFYFVYQFAIYVHRNGCALLLFAFLICFLLFSVLFLLIVFFQF